MRKLQGLGFSPGAVLQGVYPRTTRSQEVCDTRMHRHRWRRGAQLWTESILTPRPKNLAARCPEVGF
jgi:hypothetical protein